MDHHFPPAATAAEAAARDHLIDEARQRGPWKALRNYVTWSMEQDPSQGTVESVEDDRVTLLLNVPPPTPPGRSQRIFLVHYDIDGEDWVELGAPLAYTYEIDPIAALEENQRLAIGHFSIGQGMMWYRHTYQIDLLEPPWLSVLSGLILMTKLADHLQQRFGVGGY